MRSSWIRESPKSIMVNIFKKKGREDVEEGHLKSEAVM